MMDEFEFNWLQGQLDSKEWKYIVTSDKPEDPPGEKTYTYQSHTIRLHDSKFIFILNLVDESSNTVTISISDVENIEHNDLSRPESHCKMYFVTTHGRHRIIFRK